jgi:hypothetical protein
MVISIDPIRDYMRQHDCSFPGPRGAGRSARPARRTGRQTRPADTEVDPIGGFSRTLRGKAPDTPPANVFRSYIGAFSTPTLPKTKCRRWRPRKVRENPEMGQVGL